MKTPWAKAINTHFKEMPPEVERFGRLAAWDLLCGPMTYCEECGADHLSDCTCANRYPGFQKACDVVGKWASELVSDLYYDEEWDGLMESEPEGEEDPETGDYIDPAPFYHLDRSTVLAALFGKDLVEYIR